MARDQLLLYDEEKEKKSRASRTRLCIVMKQVSLKSWYPHRAAWLSHELFDPCKPGVVGQYLGRPYGKGDTTRWYGLEEDIGEISKS